MSCFVRSCIALVKREVGRVEALGDSLMSCESEVSKLPSNVIVIFASNSEACLLFCLMRHPFYTVRAPHVKLNLIKNLISS